MFGIWRKTGDGDFPLGSPLLPLFSLWCAGLLLVLYFAFERGPCHKSQRVEAIYLRVCLSLLLVAVLLGAEPDEGRPLTVLYINHCLMLLAAYAIYDSQVKLKELPSLFSDTDPRSFAQKLHRRASSPAAKRVVQLLRTEVTKIIRDGEGGGSDGTVSSFLIGLFLGLQQICMNWSVPADVFHYPACILQWLLAVRVLIIDLPRCRTTYRAASQLDDLAAVLVQKYDKEFVSDVLCSVGAATLLQVGRKKLKWELTVAALEKDVLDVQCKAVMINAMQKCGVQSLEDEEAIHDLILSCEGDDLVQLKALLDCTADYHSLFKLVYDDIRTEKTRVAIVEHLSREARKLRSLSSGAVGIKVLSDIDDTLLCSGGRFPAGCDRSIPRHVVYPGCLQLFRELDSSWQQDAPTSNLAFLSARPHMYKDMAESKSLALFWALFRQGRLHTLPGLLAGKFSLSAQGMLKSLFQQARGWRQVGENKAFCCKQYMALYEEYDFIFFGDNGQGDVLAGQKIMRRRRDATSEETCMQSLEESEREDSMEDGSIVPRLLLVLIHEVLRLEDSLFLEPLEGEVHSDALRTQLSQQGIHLFTSHLGAALHLQKALPGLMSLQQLRNVAIATRSDLEEAHAMFPDFQFWRDRERAFNADVRHVNDRLAAADAADLTLVKPLRLGEKPESLHLFTLLSRTDLAELSGSTSCCAGFAPRDILCADDSEETDSEESPSEEPGTCMSDRQQTPAVWAHRQSASILDVASWLAGSDAVES